MTDDGSLVEMDPVTGIRMTPVLISAPRTRVDGSLEATVAAIGMRTIPVPTNVNLPPRQFQPRRVPSRRTRHSVRVRDDGGEPRSPRHAVPQLESEAALCERGERGVGEA